MSRTRKFPLSTQLITSCPRETSLDNMLPPACRAIASSPREQPATQPALRHQAEISIRQAMIGLVQGKAQEEAAHQAVSLAQQSLDAEQKKLAVGASTFYNVVLRQRDLTTAQYAEIQAADAYAKSLVAIDEARGATLDRNGISFSDAVSGTITRMPAP